MLPEDYPFSGLPKTVLRYVWNVKFLKAALGLRSKEEVIEWFLKHPEANKIIMERNKSIEDNMKYLQTEVFNQLERIRINERLEELNQNMMTMEVCESRKRTKFNND